MERNSKYHRASQLEITFWIIWILSRINLRNKRVWFNRCFDSHPKWWSTNLFGCNVVLSLRSEWIIWACLKKLSSSRSHSYLAFLSFFVIVKEFQWIHLDNLFLQNPIMHIKSESSSSCQDQEISNLDQYVFRLGSMIYLKAKDHGLLIWNIQYGPVILELPLHISLASCLLISSFCCVTSIPPDILKRVIT